MDEQKKYEVIKRLVDESGNKNRAAKVLGISKRQVNRLIKAYNEKGEPIIDEETGQQLTYKVVDMVLTDDLSDIDKKAIASIKRGKNGIEVSTCDKVRALELLGKHLGMFTDKIDTNVSVNATKKLDSILKELGDSDE